MCVQFFHNIPNVHLRCILRHFQTLGNLPIGKSHSDKEQNYLVKGATGAPVRTLVNLALSLAQEQKNRR